MHRFRKALLFLTVLPVGKGQMRRDELATLLPYFPLVGALLGGLLAGAYWCARYFWPPEVAVFVVILSQTLLTGNLHLDGLADTADGVMGGTTPQQRLQIMKDSRIGTHGTVTLILVLGAKYLLLLTVLRTTAFYRPLVLFPTAGRWAAVYACTAYPYARKAAGLAQPFTSRATLPHLLVATALTAGISYACLQFMGLLAGAAVAVVTVLVAWTISSKLGGGITGDVCGALVEIAELACLATIAAGTRL